MLLGTQPADVAVHRLQGVGHQLVDAQGAEYAQQVLDAYAAASCLETPGDPAGDAGAIGELRLGEPA